MVLIEINSDDVINYDLKLLIKGKKITFYSWFNLWYATFEIISKYVIKHNYFEDESHPIARESNINAALTEINTNINDNKENERENNIEDEEDTNETRHFSSGFGQNVMTISLNKMKAKHKYGQKRKSAIQTLKNNRDLNNICDGIDELAKGKKVELLDRDNLVFTTTRKQLDKLKTKNKDNFEVKYVYQLLK